MPKERQADLSDSSKEAGTRLEKEIESRSWKIDGSHYTFRGHIDLQDGKWHYTWNTWQEINPDTGKVISSGTNPNATPGEGLYNPAPAPGGGTGADADKGNSDGSTGDTHGSILSAGTTNDSFRRGQYEGADKAASKAAQEAIEEAKQAGNAEKAVEEARAVSAARNARRAATQGELTPYGRALSQWLEGERSFDSLWKTYSGRLPSVEANKLPPAVAQAAGETTDSFEIARRIAVASGESRPIMRNLGRVGRVLGPVGMGLSVFALGNDLYHHDYSMATGDAFTVAGTGIEMYALATSGAGATVAGVSAIPLGLAVGGVGIAVTSFIGAKRAFERGDYVTGTVDSVGVAAGVAITVGAIGVLAGVAAAPVILAVGVVAAVGVGLYHLGSWISSWF